jgi:hypothetical protein
MTITLFSLSSKSCMVARERERKMVEEVGGGGRKWLRS